MKYKDENNLATDGLYKQGNSLHSTLCQHAINLRHAYNFENSMI